MQAALLAWRVRKCGRRGMQGTIAGTRSMITKLRSLQIGHVEGDGHGESSAGNALLRRVASADSEHREVAGIGRVVDDDHGSPRTVVADTDKAVGERMHQEAADELAAGQLHDFGLLAIRVILVLKAYLTVTQLDEPLVRDGHAMGVTGQVLEHPLRAAKRSLGVDDPILFHGCIKLALPGGRLDQGCQLAVEVKFAAAIGAVSGSR